jgi:hypothetical protein
MFKQAPALSCFVQILLWFMPPAVAVCCALRRALCAVDVPYPPTHPPTHPSIHPSIHVAYSFISHLDGPHLHMHAQSSEQRIDDLQERLSLMEQRQHNLITFFATALKDPRTLQRLLSQISSAGVQRLEPPSAGTTGQRNWSSVWWAGGGRGVWCVCVHAATEGLIIIARRSATQGARSGAHELRVGAALWLPTWMACWVVAATT